MIFKKFLFSNNKICMAVRKMQQVVQKESQEEVQTIYIWKHFCWQFLLSLRPLCLTVFLFCLHFCILIHFEILRCIVKSLIPSHFNRFIVEIQLKKENLKSAFGRQSLGDQTGKLVSQTA